MFAPTNIHLSSDINFIVSTSNEIWNTRSFQEVRNLYACAALKNDGSVITWGESDSGGDSSSVSDQLSSSVSQIFCSQEAFAALKEDGSVVTWGKADGGGDSSSVSNQINSGVSKIFSTQKAFAALKEDGSVVTWGGTDRGGDSSSVSAHLSSGISNICSSHGAFAALKDDGSVISWGPGIYGGVNGIILTSGVSKIYANSFSFIALKDDGSVFTWGLGSDGGDSSSVSDQLSSGVFKIFANSGTYAALKEDGSVVTWGENDFSISGADSSGVADQLASGVKTIVSGGYSYAALKEDGSVVTWGMASSGGDSSSVSDQLSTGVSTVVASYDSYAALKEDGSVVSWGTFATRNTFNNVSEHLTSGVKNIVANIGSFAALMSNGSVITWGRNDLGGDSSSVLNQLKSNVSKIFSFAYGFAALKNDGSLITWGKSSTGGDSSSVNDELSSGIIGFIDPFTDDNRIQGFYEHIGSSQTIATLTSTDQDNNDTHTYSLVSGNGDSDNHLFTINQNNLILNESPDHETKTSYQIRLQTTDQNGNSYQKTFLLYVKDLNEINGGSTTDNLITTSSDDYIDGQSGIDTAVFNGKFSDYSFKRRTETLQISSTTAGTFDGTDTLSNIEYIQFSDQTVEESKVDIVKTYSGDFSDYKFYNKGNGVYQIKTDSGYDDITGLPLLTFTGESTTSSFRDVSAIIDIKGTFDQVTGLNTDDAKMFRLYNAAFKRLPDADGLNYWIGKYTSGENDDRAVASSFLVSAEFSERYGANVTNAKYVETLYVNVLGRDYDQEGYNYWLGNLNSGQETRYELLLGFAESAENKTLFTEMTGFG